MARNEADTDARRAIEVRENRGQMLEPVPNGSSLTRCVLEQYPDLVMRPRPEGRGDGISDQPQGIVLRARCARPWMDDHAMQAEGCGPIELVDEGVNRLLSKGRNRRRQVDQVAGVRDDRFQTCFVDTLAKSNDLVWSERLAEPLVGILAEDLQGFAAMHECAIDCL
jgi:hypothetical protein